MERRRFVPSPEGLEGRALLSTVAAAAPSQAASRPAAATVRPLANSGLPESYSQKLQRIENLPYFLEQLQPGRFLPRETIESIQANLIELTARLNGPPASLLESFNVELRDTIAEASLSARNAADLNHVFGAALEGAGASTALVTRFTADMNQLAQVDSQSPNPTYLASNDYAIILQTALAVGRPIQAPRAPRLATGDGRMVENGQGGVTTMSRPTLVGVYEAGAGDGGTTRVEILDADGRILGSGTVGTDGRYSATVTEPLAEGQYSLTARAIDRVGNQSRPSPRFVLRVVSPPSRPAVAAQVLAPPKGPLGLR